MGTWPPMDQDDDKALLLGRLGGDPGLCRTCEHLRLLASPRSVFARCGLADADPSFPRYPPLPVRRCHGYSLQRPAAPR